MTNSTVHESLSYGQGIRILGSAPVLTDNTFSNSGVALSMDLDSNPAISGVTLTNNTINGLQVDGGTMVEDGFWDDPDIVYVTTGDITVPEGITLTIDPGQVVKVGNYNYDFFINGILDRISNMPARDEKENKQTNNNQ